MQFTKEAQELAKPCYEAIKKIAERTKIECPICAGRGREPVIGDYAMRQTSQECERCNGTGKVKGKWEWKPEGHDTCINEKGPHKIEYIVLSFADNHLTLDPPVLGNPWTESLRWKFIPLLHWERIEEILEGMGYDLSIDIIGATGQIYLPPQGHHIEIYDKYNKLKAEADAKTRQVAVQKAVIELAKRKEIE